jgi:hypothetical protein
MYARSRCRYPVWLRRDAVRRLVRWFLGSDVWQSKYSLSLESNTPETMGRSPTLSRTIANLQSSPALQPKACRTNAAHSAPMTQRKYVRLCTASSLSHRTIILYSSRSGYQGDMEVSAPRMRPGLVVISLGPRRSVAIGRCQTVVLQTSGYPAVSNRKCNTRHEQAKFNSPNASSYFGQDALDGAPKVCSLNRWRKHQPPTAPACQHLHRFQLTSLSKEKHGYET